MDAEKHRTRQEDTSAAEDYLRKAEDNHSQMVIALNAGNHNAAGTLALQCAISSADAICVQEKGVRSASEDHRDVCGLVASITIPDAREKAKVLSRIIGRKHMIQYERRPMRKVEAEEIVKAASRFYQWVSAHVR
jgi:HEPN domain-containing protein